MTVESHIDLWMVLVPALAVIINIRLPRHIDLNSDQILPFKPVMATVMVVCSTRTVPPIFSIGGGILCENNRYALPVMLVSGFEVTVMNIVDIVVDFPDGAAPRSAHVNREGVS